MAPSSSETERSPTGVCSERSGTLCLTEPALISAVRAVDVKGGRAATAEDYFLFVDRMNAIRSSISLLLR